MYLVDTDVISSSAPGRSEGAVANWMDRNSANLFISAVTVAEVESGIAKANRSGSRSQVERLNAWLETILHLYADRVLAFDIAAARCAGRLSDEALAKGQNPGFADLTIAGTARSRGLTLLSRNVRHFKPLGLLVVDPFTRLPSN